MWWRRGEKERDGKSVEIDGCRIEERRIPNQNPKGEIMEERKEKCQKWSS